MDEFHHASAPVYRNLLAYFEPLFLLGLTATPERTDQADILGLCDNNLVYERNLTQGIDDDILAPFKYYGIWDESINYQAIPWRNGRFDPASIEHQFATQKRANHILKHWQQHKQLKTLAFCISTKHADFMAASFNQAGISALSVHSRSSIRRNEALDLLETGQISVLFSVDLFNEGTDLPAIDTILMLRPSDSKILFLQQLGRGLRLHYQKKYLLVLDFIGNHHSFLNKPYALLGSSSVRELASKINNPQLAKGCFVNYDLEITQFWEALAKQQRTTAIEDYVSIQQQLGHRPTASEYWAEYGDLNKVNKQHHSWMQLVAAQSKDAKLDNLLKEQAEFLYEAVQTTVMTKCFKAILLSSFLRLDGFVHPPKLIALAQDSWKVLDRYPQLKQSELPEKQSGLKAESTAWFSYWKSNPIKAFCNANKKTGKQWFKIENDHLVANVDLNSVDLSLLHDAVQELVELRLLQYAQRPEKLNRHLKTAEEKEALFENRKGNKKVAQLAYYPNLKIACGHFKTGNESGVDLMDAPNGFGHLQGDRHFLARASGDSMNGGKNPVQDGDLLLLEWITPISAGSLQGLIVAIEMLDDAGDNQYLLRVVKKIADGRYQLLANNRDYKTIDAKDDMKSFARLKGVVS